MGLNGPKYGPPNGPNLGQYMGQYMGLNWAHMGPNKAHMGPLWAQLAEYRNHPGGRLTIFCYHQTNEKLPYIRLLYMYIYAANNYK